MIAVEEGREPVDANCAARDSRERYLRFEREIVDIWGLLVVLRGFEED